MSTQKHLKYSQRILILVATLFTPTHLTMADVERIQEFTHSDEWNNDSNFTANQSSMISGVRRVNLHRVYARFELCDYDQSSPVSDAVIRVKKSYAFNNCSSSLSLYDCMYGWDESVTWTTSPIPNYYLNAISMRVWNRNMWGTQAQVNYYENIAKHVHDMHVAEINGIFRPYESPTATYYNGASNTKTMECRSTA